MTSMPPPIAKHNLKTLECASPSHGYDELDVLSIEVRALQEARAQEAFEAISFLSPEVEQGPLNFDGFAAVNSFMEEHGQMAIMHTPCEWTFIPEARARAIVLYDSENEELALDGLLTTESSQPFIGDMVIDFAGSAVLYDSSTGIGLTLHSSDGVLLYRQDRPDFLDVEMNSEWLKELMVTADKRNKRTNDLFVSTREGQNPPEGILPNIVEVIKIEQSDVEQAAA